MAIIPQNVYYGIKTKYLNKFKIDYQGTVATVSDLPTENIAEGTVYNVESNGSNYLWNGSEWDELGNSGKNSIYCSDCNNALIPGRYYIDSSTANSPESANGILLVESKGGANDSVWQTVKIDSTGHYYPIYKRQVAVSSGNYSSSTPWKFQDFISNIPDNRTLFKKSGSTVVLCPPAGGQLQGQSGSVYELLRLYHFRDANRDSSLNSYGFIGRFANTYAPTTSNNQAQFIIGESCGGIASSYFVFGAYYGCASIVTYTDETEETVLGVYLKIGDTYNNKTVASVSYNRFTATAAPWFTFSKDNLATIGKSDSRFATIYAGTGSIDTSDERLKQSIESIPDEVLDAWGEVGWVQYQFNDAVEKKGEDARLHTGAVAQRIDAIFKSHGLDASQYGLFCYDVWEDEYDTDEDGVQHKIKDAGDRYSLRYEEALCMEAAYQRRRADRAEVRIKALEDRLEALEARLG